MFIQDTSKGLEVSAASIVAPKLIEALDALYTLLFAYTKIDANENMRTAHQNLSVLVHSFR